jgi:hypothetical protein
MRIDLGLRQSVADDQAGVTDISQISHGLDLCRAGSETPSVNQSWRLREISIYIDNKGLISLCLS